jgi:RES domain-containing protein
LALYVLTAAQVPEGLIETLQPRDLPDDWRTTPETNSTREIGTKWVAEGRSAVLAVPSVVVPSEFNYLLNPAHPDFSKIKIGKPKPIDWDPRGENSGKRISAFFCATLEASIAVQQESMG